MGQHRYLARLAQGRPLFPCDQPHPEPADAGTYMPASFPRVRLEGDSLTPVVAWQATAPHAWEALLVAALWDDEQASSAHDHFGRKLTQSAALAVVLSEHMLKTTDLDALLETLVAGSALELLLRCRRDVGQTIEQQDRGRSRGVSDVELRARLAAASSFVRSLDGPAGRYSADGLESELALHVRKLEQDLAYREFHAAQRKGAQGKPTTPRGLLAHHADLALEALAERRRDDLLAALSRDFVARPFDDGRSVREFLKASRRKRYRKRAGV